jgi:DNA-directed RNA polymerase subunit beta'
LPEVYAELAEDVDLGSETLVSETEIDWEVIKKLREANVKSVR